MKLLLHSSMCRETHFPSLVNSTGTAETFRSSISLATLIEDTRKFSYCNRQHDLTKYKPLCVTNASMN